MQNDRTSDMAGGGGHSVPGGFEVESERLHMPTDDGGQHTSGITQPGWMEALHTWKSRGMSSIGSLKPVATETLHKLKSRSVSGIHSLKGTVNQTMMRTGTHLRAHPAQWTGAAVGAGFGIGLIGRLLMSRSGRTMPDVIVISSV